MICPQCKAEYRDGFYKCADCGIDLISALPPETGVELRPIDFVEVYFETPILKVKSGECRA
jgi:hypothetical protein